MAKHKATRRAGREGPPRPRQSRQRPAKAQKAGAGGRLWLYGTHAVLAALANPERRLFRLLVTEEAEQRLGASLEESLSQSPSAPVLRRCARSELAAQLPDGAVHQGLGLESAPLDPPALEDLLEPGPAASETAPQLILALDQVTDPHNVGAILRSAAAFGARAVIAPRNHAAPESGTLAKSASGALERLPYSLVTNLARALDLAAEAGFLRLGLDAEGETALPALAPEPRIVLVLGAEGSGLRRLTRERCDRLVRLPTLAGFGSLNVSNAAAVALYELLGRAGSAR